MHAGQPQRQLSLLCTAKVQPSMSSIKKKESRMSLRGPSRGHVRARVHQTAGFLTSAAALLCIFESLKAFGLNSPGDWPSPKLPCTIAHMPCTSLPALGCHSPATNMDLGRSQQKSDLRVDYLRMLSRFPLPNPTLETTSTKT